ncbi:MAG: hypothetical protein IJQ68_03740 [Methanobrevibacter sp.]|uniref:hypothetical protein n=1 Tax=Methanobrevibacter sp. TaxID=66852 RepID=UPI0025EF4314|nr:hypothetical protein [Methanobrevibacter sp.]MBR0271090.1 hypothetical protein [Methanobrevibacter sp.]
MNTFQADSKSISINPKFETQINNIYQKTMLNTAKLTLNLFNIKYMEMFENLARFYGKNEDMIDFSDSLSNIINIYLNELENSLKIKNEKDLDELNSF